LPDDERLFARPNFDIPELDGSDLTMVADSTLMEMFSKAVAWQNFADTIATEAEIKEADFAARVEQAESSAVLWAWTNASTTVGPRGGVKSEFTATVAKAQRDTDPEVGLLREQFRLAKAARKRAQTVRDNSERLANLLSRELSRRIGRDGVQQRAGRFGT
jgi:hypothetical protein